MKISENNIASDLKFETEKLIKKQKRKGPEKKHNRQGFYFASSQPEFNPSYNDIYGPWRPPSGMVSECRARGKV